MLKADNNNDYNYDQTLDKNYTTHYAWIRGLNIKFGSEVLLQSLNQGSNQKSGSS